MENKQTKDQQEKCRIRAQAARDRLSDGYVRNLLTKNSHLRACDIPQALVDVKKAHLLLKRGLKAIREDDDDKIKKLDLLNAQMNPGLYPPDSICT